MSFLAITFTTQQINFHLTSGFIILLTSIFTFFFFGEIRLIAAFTRLMDYNNSFSFSFLFSIFLSFLWIGAQFPQEKFLSYGRILTLHYYFLLMCILFSIISTFIGILLTFSPMHFLGFNVMPRRIPDFPDYFHDWNSHLINSMHFPLVQEPASRKLSL